MKIQNLFISLMIVGAAVSLAVGQRGARPPQGLPPAKCENAKSALPTLLQMEIDDGTKTPLILIHGIHGTELDEEVTQPGNYWKEFLSKYKEKDNGLSQRYSLYLFQFCSDRDPVSEIATKLRDRIDAKLKDRPHVILAHSMGGLVAKYYMVNTAHRSGAWINKLGGDTVIGLITLATPHHGAHGANDTDSLSQYIPFGWKTVLNSVNLLYWKGGTGKWFSPPGINSGTPNRSDLRWDNYDNAITGGNDVNLWLAPANLRFEQYAYKTILYAGYTKFANDVQTPSQAVGNGLQAKFSDVHKRASFANDLLINGYGGKFGNTDGLVPFTSGLLCDPPPYLISSTTQNFICISKYRARRFEAGQFDALPNELPAGTLSIKRRESGYDHKYMYEDSDVLRYVVSDLKNFIPDKQPVIEPPVPKPNIPTLFLFDVSGSMNDNDKIGQARVAGLDALKEMREAGSPPTSIMTFSGDQCGGNVTKKLLGYTTNLTEAENVMRLRLPTPNGGTPIPQARDAAFADISAYLDSNANLKEGRIILLSDGQSTCGEIRPAGVFSRRTDIGIRRVNNSRIRYFTIGFDMAPGSAAERDLQYLASESGGKYYNAADRDQLIRALKKQVRHYAPKQCNSGNADFANGLRAFADYDYPAATEAFRRYSSTNQTDWCGFYNLALAYEASDHYKKAADNYQKYLNSSPSSPDRAKIEAKIVEMNEEYAGQFDYYTRLIASDLDYLNGFYKTVFNHSSADLAAEFDGFMFEKRDFYVTLSDTLEIDARWLVNDGKDISSSMDVLAKRRKLASFDRDAVSLLTIPIGQIEDLIVKLKDFKRQNLRNRE